MDDSNARKVAQDYVGTEGFNEWIKKVYNRIIEDEKKNAPHVTS